MSSRVRGYSSVTPASRRGVLAAPGAAQALRPGRALFPGRRLWNSGAPRSVGRRLAPGPPGGGDGPALWQGSPPAPGFPGQRRIPAAGGRANGVPGGWLRNSSPSSSPPPAPFPCPFVGRSGSSRAGGTAGRYSPGEPVQQVWVLFVAPLRTWPGWRLPSGRCRRGLPLCGWRPPLPDPAAGLTARQEGRTRLRARESSPGAAGAGSPVGSASRGGFPGAAAG